MGKVYDLHYDVPDEDYIIIKQRLSELPDKFWKDVDTSIKRGGGSEDKHGHIKEIRIKANPILSDLVVRIREAYPNWYKSQMAASRAALSVGIHFMIALIDNPKPPTRFDKALQRLEMLTRPVNKLDEIEEFEKKKLKVINSSNMSEHTKEKWIKEYNSEISIIKEEIEKCIKNGEYTDG